MTVVELNRTVIDKVGPTEPTLKEWPTVHVHEYYRERVFKDVAKALGPFKEVSRRYIDEKERFTLCHNETDNELTEEWLFEYLAKAIDFKYPQPDNDRGLWVSGRVPEWLPIMMLKRAYDFECTMKD